MLKRWSFESIGRKTGFRAIPICNLLSAICHHRVAVLGHAAALGREPFGSDWNQ
jgi:hypothetical protein